VDRLTLDRGSFAHSPGALGREWLVTNSLGGYAAGTIAQANTRRYHGILVAALRPPVERVMLVAKLDASARYRGARFELACNEFADGTLAPRGFERLADFALEGRMPVWTYAIGDAQLEQRLWMAHGLNTTYVSFTSSNAAEPIELELVPLCAYRDYHSHQHAGNDFRVELNGHGCRIVAFDGAHPYWLSTDRGEFVASPEWYWRFAHRLEAERGLDALEDLFRPGEFRARLAPGETVTFIASAESAESEPARTALVSNRERDRKLVSTIPAAAPSWVRRLTLAADQFIVARGRISTGTAKLRDAGKTVIAGYPWFSDWGRDTMIALPGLALATGRHDAAAAILRTFAEHASQGMLPNRFPDDGSTPEYNTVDATLWFFHAISAYFEATGDREFLREIYPTLVEVIGWHRRGTRYGIQVDAADGLLRSGEPGVQLTWMDAKVGDWVVTPRTGKAVEINALWHFALSSMAIWAKLLGDPAAAADYAYNSDEVRTNFGRAFWYEDGGYLYDVVDTPDGSVVGNGRRVDASLRPNQIFAVSLGTGLLDAPRARAVVDVCARELLTPTGLRSLAPGDARYVHRYEGGPRERDGAYHQGTVWSWLLGPFALAHFNVYRDPDAALALLSALAPHLGDACLGSVSEIFDADPPHAPRGCFAQAWSVAETLRAWHSVTRSMQTESLGVKHG